MGRGRERGKWVLASISIYMFHKDESKCDMDVILRQLRGHFKLTYKEGWSSFKMAPLSPGSKIKRKFNSCFPLLFIN